MPCTVYSGIEPSTALLNEMFKRQSLGDQHLAKPPLGVAAAPQRPAEGPDGAAPAYSPPAPGAQIGGGMPALPPRPGEAVPAPSSVRPQAGRPGGAGPSGVPDVPPPSYEDAMAEDLAPVDGPRTNYEQPQTAPVVGDEKRGSLFGK